MIKIRNLNLIQMFNAVSQLENITRAANSLNISQSSASYHIKKLEAELKISVFNRRPFNVENISSPFIDFHIIRLDGIARLSKIS